MINTENQGLIADGLDLIDRAAQLADDKGNPDFLYHYASAVADIVSILSDDSLFDSDNHISKAMRRISKAQSRQPNEIKYFVVKARLYEKIGNLEKARDSVEEAIKIAGTKGIAGAMQIRDLEGILQNIETKKSLERIESLETKAKEIENKMQEQTRHSVEFVGVFSALVALVITSATLLSGLQFIDAALILLILGGLLIILLETAVARVAPSKSNRLTFVFIFVGFLLVIIGIIAKLLFP